MKVSVLVLTYNTELDKLYLTLQSIMQQSFQDYEIVVTDDGSKDNKFSQIEGYFKRNNFNKYKMVSNKKNQGTVKNIISGLEHATGKYVKLFGAGDAFFDENTMSDLYDFMEKNHSECCFGLIEGYCLRENKTISKVPYWHPFDIDAYRQENKEAIVRNLVLYSDNTCGAAIFYGKAFCQEYMNKIKDVVVYEEDIFQVLSAVEGRPLNLYDKCMIWYEIGEGVSTKKRSKFALLLKEDVDRFYEHLYLIYGKNKYVKKRHKLKGLYKIDNLYIRTILRIFVNPDSVRYLLVHAMQKKKGSHIPQRQAQGFLERLEFWNSI